MHHRDTHAAAVVRRTEALDKTARVKIPEANRLGDTLREHERIGDRLAARDPSGAEASMKRHIQAAAKRYGISIG